MYVGLSLLLLAVAALSAVAGVRVRPARPDTDQVRGFCLVGALGSAVVGLAVLGMGLWWDGRIADTVALIAMFALVVYFLLAWVVGVWPRRGPAEQA